MAWVLTRNDVATYGGLPASALVPDARQIGNIISSTVELCGHGFDPAPVRFSAGAGATLDTALDPLTWYTAVSDGDPDFFTLLDGSTPVTLAGDSVGAIFVLEDVTPKIAAICSAVTSYLVAHAKAYSGPWTTPPGWAPRAGAHLAAPDIAAMLRISAARYDVEATMKRFEAAEALCVRLNKGEPLSDGVGPVDADPLVANMAPRFVKLGTGGPLGGDFV